tara:strand:- start:1590 stop:2066 length:477 start_codon:yes stop_codon:yes gene_type:complete
MGDQLTDPFSNLPMSTYYWAHPEIIDRLKFATFREICELIIETSNQDVGNGLGKVGSSPTLDEEVISFNGVFPECRETFYFPMISEDIDFLTPDEKGNYYRFCETGGQSYDILVSACLSAAKFIGIIEDFGREEGDIPKNLLWEAIEQHLTLGENDAN